MAKEHYDLVVIGSGQAGNPLATAFADAGQRVAVIEREHVGGTCVNEGCTPTKTLIASGRVAHLARRAHDYGIGTGQVTVDMPAVRARKRKVVESFRSGSENGLDRAGVTLIAGEGRFLDDRTIQVAGGNGLRSIGGDRIVINTGLVPRIPDLNGLARVPYLTSRSILELDRVPEHLLILGGGYIGLEFAQLYRRLGAEVTVVQHGPRLMPREDTDIVEAITTILREDGCTILLGTEATAVRGAAGDITLSVESGGQTRDISGSDLLVAVGRRPDTASLNPKAAGLRITRQGFIAVTTRLVTSVPHIYALGDVTGAPAFTHIAYDDFRILRTNLLEGGRASRHGRLVPYTLFIDPQLGRIGITEREAIDQKLPHRVATLPMTRVARAIETGETRGMMKAIVDTRTDRILGAAILGTEGGEVATVLQVAMMGKLRWQQLRDVAIAHPTWSESLNNLFMTL
ncbi:MAG TPA: mercuric reductase [Gemmatimonadales bacterium]|nr:mercuric reductase [Gemmatimonadales bacterium]